MFIDIPKLFDKNFVTGYLLPAILFTLLTGWLVQLAYNFQLIDFQLKWVQQNTRNLMVVKIPDVPEATFILGVVILVCLTLAILLLSLNRLLTRLLEGYLAPVKWLRFIEVRNYRQMNQEFGKISDAYLDETLKDALSDATGIKYMEAVLKRTHRFPDSEALVLATSFGNTLRAAEVYPRVVYGVDVIPIWPRMLEVMSEKYLGFLDSAKASVDFAVNSFFLLWVFLIEVIVFFQTSPNQADLWQNYWPFLPVTLVLIVGAYFLAVSSAAEWGNLIRAASDLFINDLIEKVGYEIPETNGERKDLLTSLSRSFMYEEPLPARTVKKKTATRTKKT
jgi:hypothetical protein